MSPTWEPSHSRAAAWPTTGADRPAAPGAQGLPAGPQGPWSTGAGGSLGSTHADTRAIVVKKMQGENKASLVVCLRPGRQARYTRFSPVCQVLRGEAWLLPSVSEHIRTAVPSQVATLHTRQRPGRLTDRNYTHEAILEESNL